MLILWMSSLLFLFQLHLICSAHIYSRLPEKSGNSCWSTQTSSLLTVFSASTPKLGVFHDLPKVPGSLVFVKACLDPGKLASAMVEFLKMENAGIDRRSSSPWSSPLHMLPKPDGTWRPFGNFQRFNTAPVPDRYPLPSERFFTNSNGHF